MGDRIRVSRIKVRMVVLNNEIHKFGLALIMKNGSSFSFEPQSMTDVSFAYPN